MRDTQIHIAKNLRWSVLTKIIFFFPLLLMIIMDPFVIGVWVEKIQLESEVEAVIPRTVGVENMTTGPWASFWCNWRSLSLWVTIADKIVSRV